MSGHWNRYKSYNFQSAVSNLESYWTPVGIKNISGVSIGTSTNENRTISGVLMNNTHKLYSGPSLVCGASFEAAFVTSDGEMNTLVLLSYQGITHPGESNLPRSVYVAFRRPFRPIE